MDDDITRLEECWKELFWQFSDLARRFEDAADRLAEEGRRIDLHRAEEARKDAHQSH
jgi:hypothetical protein